MHSIAIRQLKPRPRRRGLSLVELLVVAGIILLVLSMIMATLVKTYHAVEKLKG